MEAHVCQCDGEKNDKFYRNNALVSQNNDNISKEWEAEVSILRKFLIIMTFLITLAEMGFHICWSIKSKYF